MNSRLFLIFLSTLCMLCSTLSVAYSHTTIRQLNNESQYDHTYPKNHKDFALSLNIPTINASYVASSSDTYFALEQDQDMKWVRCHEGKPLPLDAVVGGSEPNRLLFICRAFFNESMHPGKLVDGKCNIAYRDREIALNNYEILVSHKALAWLAASHGQFPAGSVIGGSSLRRHTTFYICQAWYENGIHPGKLIGEGCHITWGGREIEIPFYNVLVR